MYTVVVKTDFQDGNGEKSGPLSLMTELSAPTIEQLYAKMARTLAAAEYDHYWSDDTIHVAFSSIFEVTSMSEVDGERILGCPEWINRREMNRLAREDAERERKRELAQLELTRKANEEERERAELARLKEKYGD